VSTRRSCSGAEHELRWSEGRLALVDHPDVTAEAALGALGGTTPSCLHVAAAWHERADDPVLLTLGRRPGEAEIGLGGDGPLPAGARLLDSDRATRRDRLLLLFTLPAVFIDRLVLTAAADAARRWPDGEYRRRHGLRLGAALAARATPALRRIGASLAGPDEGVVVHVAPTAPGERFHVRASRTTAGIAVSGSLPLSWLSEVWGPGISEPDGQLVLAVHHVQDGGRAVDVSLAQWEPDGPGEWELDRRPAVLRRDDPSSPWTAGLR
jgi:hypothetical protein